MWLFLKVKTTWLSGSFKEQNRKCRSLQRKATGAGMESLIPAPVAFSSERWRAEAGWPERLISI
jgi:hypothetical protein